MDPARANRLETSELVRLVVADLYRRVLADEAISGYFVSTDVDVLAAHVVDVVVHALDVVSLDPRPWTSRPRPYASLTKHRPWTGRERTSGAP